MKHLKHTLCVYSHSNICNIEIYFCTIQMKHLQYKYETPEKLKTLRLKHARYATSIYISATSK
jgi:hypothetical protein